MMSDALTNVGNGILASALNQRYTNNFSNLIGRNDVVCYGIT